MKKLPQRNVGQSSLGNGSSDTGRVRPTDDVVEDRSNPDAPRSDTMRGVHSSNVVKTLS